MRVGYLRNSGNSEALKGDLAVLEKAECDRIVIDHESNSDEPAELIGLISCSLQAGDAIVVCGMEEVAGSLSQLVSFLMSLDGREIRFQSLSEGLDTAGSQGAAFKALLRQLRTFEVRARSRTGEAGGRRRRAGRPKALCVQAIDEARALINKGEAIAEVAQKYRVSKATLYRYLGTPYGA